MRSILVFLFVSSTIIGCANPGVVQLSPDTYMITRTDKGGVFGNPSKMKAAVIQDANDFATAQGKVAIPISADEISMKIGRFASFEYQFRVVSKDDPEYRRASLEKIQSLKIDEKQDIDLSIENAGPETAEDAGIYQQILLLDDLRKRGLLTDKEFDQEKQKLLSE